MRETFAKDTIQMLRNVEKRSCRQKKVRMRQFEKAAVVCMAILLLGSGSVALAESLDLGRLIRERFHDEISADKYEFCSGT
ncbi:MAG: hypothetical protein K2G55_04860 [Lachnospiraceae bacterium]|nr:hypothetical protein [Lachnospiraceae bacterium]MDE7205405.1 hypothetical protein [Lachnospiraceae bacterium]